MPAATFATITEAARRIVELEGIPKNGLFLEWDVETNELGTDKEAFRVMGRSVGYANIPAVAGLRDRPTAQHTRDALQWPSSGT